MAGASSQGFPAWWDHTCKRLGGLPGGAVIGVTHDMEVAGADSAGKLNTNIKNSRYVCKHRGCPSRCFSKWDCNAQCCAWAAVQHVMAMSAHGAAWVWLLVPPRVLGAEHLPGVPGASQVGTCGKGHCGKCCRSSLFYTPAEQKHKGSMSLCCFHWAFIEHLVCTFKTTLCNTLRKVLSSPTC